MRSWPRPNDGSCHLIQSLTEKAFAKARPQYLGALPGSSAPSSLREAV